jgi:hypothetical protein
MKNEWSFEIFKSILIFEMEISKLSNYSAKMWQSCQGNTGFI